MAEKEPTAGQPYRAGEKIRFIVLEDVKGQTVTIFVEAPASGFEEFLPRAQKLLKTVEWEGASLRAPTHIALFTLLNKGMESR